MQLGIFKKTIRDYYKKHGRHDLPWRKTRDPYKILVSEIMLQQTQVSRVIPKYNSFLKNFPDTKTLAQAKLSEVLREWQGLGYNRRGKYLKDCAEKIEKDFGGKFPAKTPALARAGVRLSLFQTTIRDDFKLLCSLPGIGPATAGDIMAFAWNIPVPLIETNIRNVFIHFFFRDFEKVSDKEILKLVEKTLDQKNPREWYWALFDYGAFLKGQTGRTVGSQNLNSKSKHYVKQSPFKNSNRQKRSQILKLILEKPRTEKEIVKSLGYDVEIISKNILTLQKEKIIQKVKNQYSIL